MKFCEDCGDYLVIKETRVGGVFKICYFCEACMKGEECLNTCVYNKVYKKEKDLVNYDTSLNKYHIQDSTLPTKTGKCTHCKKTNNNPYYVKYINNSFNIIMICKKCLKNFKF